jgi:hypothetical protein
VEVLRVLLPAEFTEAHRKLALAYLVRGHTFNPQEWREAIPAFDLLHDAAVVTSTGVMPFPVLYQREIEARYAAEYIQLLWQGEGQSTAHWAAVARRIPQDLAQKGFYRPTMPATRFLLVYCLYWWRAFTLGYALEVEIQRDLEATGVRFEADDLLTPRGRRAPFDLAVSGFKGDVKTSLYFLHATRSRALRHDFYITRVVGGGRVRTLVVFLQPEMWQTIDGDTLLVLLTKIATHLPDALRLVYEGHELVVVDYALWKQKILQYQKRS